jgi:hypothetical protein
MTEATKTTKAITTKPAPKTKAAPKKAQAPKPAPKHTALPRIARELGIDPKTARAKLRKSHGAAWKALPEAEIRTLIAA